VAVDDLSFTVPPGQMTGFLGPNGAGKCTTMRLILSLDAPDSGSVTVGRLPCAAYRRPLPQVGALLEVKVLHGGRSAAICKSCGDECERHARWNGSPSLFDSSD
jgi:ABC-2 type transport system ATP-binding protein